MPVATLPISHSIASVTLFAASQILCNVLFIASSVWVLRFLQEYAALRPHSLGAVPTSLSSSVVVVSGGVDISMVTPNSESSPHFSP